ncbi:hypothetical protein [Virgibacillus sp. SK37]|uniref:hypothetical protein n=1 Tax=Virgibacillus sp. SK37 TaxID=403957 RepID=UPI0004D0BD84|nr:hypothetical protein [Virgibacillus sp. SK37]AIF45130.1 hypothetical protein X953_01815 [Virgibacillus sp. SK37]
MAKVRYTVSFLPNDHELLRFVGEKKKTQNFSAYVRELIRSDMRVADKPELERIYEYVIKRIKEDGYVMEDKDSNKVADFIDETDKEIIMDLF